MIRRLSLLSLLALSPAAAAQQPAPPLEAAPVAGGVHVLEIRSGNVAFSAGADGVFLVDDQYAPLTERLRTAIGAVSDGPIRFVLNTHWHPDHTGGNENLGAAGTLIVAHDNVRRRMSTEQFIGALNATVPASPAGALPVVTFSDAVTFHLNGDEIHAFRVPPAHTDGDAVVHFRRANVVHLGDIYFSGAFPFVDASSGGRVQGVVDAVDRVLALSDENTRFIAGHGPVTGRAELQAFRDMVAEALARVRAAMQGGRTLDEVKAARPLAPLEERWGRGHVGADAFVAVLFEELSGS